MHRSLPASKRPPGPRGLPLIGNAVEYLRDPLSFLVRIAREYGDIVQIRLPGLPALMLSHPADIEQVLRGDHRNFIKDKVTRSMSGLLGQGLLTSEGDFWRRQRQLVQPAFQSQQLQRYADVMVDHAVRMTAEWREGQPLCMFREMSRLTARIVAQTLFNAQVDDVAADVTAAVEDVMAHFANPAMSFSRLGAWLPTPSRRRFDRARRRLDEIIHDIIRQRRSGDHDPGDLLGRLLAAVDEAGGRMTDAQLRDELITLFLAGHETTSLALSFTFYLLALHPAAAERLEAELDAVVGDRPPTASDVPRLSFADCVVRESMRLYPPAWSIAREAVADCRIGEYDIPRGTQLWPVQWVVHHDARWFDDPYAFRPERWEDDRARNLPRCAYFPFGDGPRSCIGQSFAMLEAVLILAVIARRWRPELRPGFELQLAPSITLRPRAGIPMIVRARPDTRRSLPGKRTVASHGTRTVADAPGTDSAAAG
jgi:cytochrome P450